MENTWLIAAEWMGLALVAALIAGWTGISLSLVEIAVGVIAGNFLGLHPNDWVNFLAGVGSIMLTFLAGSEVDPVILRTKFKESVSIGFVSFLFPFLAAYAYAYYVAGWTLQASQIAGIALSTTSVAVVYAVMLETGLNQTELGKIILAACFVTDLGTVLALGIIFASFNKWMFLFVAVAAVVLPLMPRFSRWFVRRYGGRVSQMEVKYFLFLLFGLGGLAAMANSEAVLPAYLLGLTVAGFFLEEEALPSRMRTMNFSLLTPFFFLKAGTYISLKAMVAGAGLIAILLLVKVAAKFLGVWPATRLFRFASREGMYTTLLMSTGLTFGSISALFGLTHGYIDQSQYTVLVTAVVLSAVIPTLIAQAFFMPRVEAKGVYSNSRAEERSDS